MKTLLLVFAFSTGCLATAAETPKDPSPELGGTSVLSGNAASQMTPAQQKINWAEKTLREEPAKYQSHNLLALALAERVGETGDPSPLGRAQEALDKSLRLAPGNFEARKTAVLLFLQKHEDAKAMAAAQALNREVPDDIQVWGYISEAAQRLGEYDEAEHAAQWMLDLRRYNVPGLLEGAQLRTVYGDLDGAIEFLNLAYQELPPTEIGQVAEILCRMADLQLMTGKTIEAGKLGEQALTLLPGYYHALETLTRARLAQGQYAQAVAMAEERNRQFANLRSRYLLAQALEKSGKEEAQAAYVDFERQASAQLDQPDNDDLDLTLEALNRQHNPAEALRVGKAALAQRHDVFTVGAFAWALYANAHYAEAHQQIARALAQGTKDAQLLYYAGEIASKVGDHAGAVKYLRQSLELDPVSEVAVLAKQSLDGLAPAAASATETPEK